MKHVLKPKKVNNHIIYTFYIKFDHKTMSELPEWDKCVLNY